MLEDPGIALGAYQSTAVLLDPRLTHCSMSLARREMALILASFFLKYELYSGGKGGHTMELYETERARDIDANSDFIIPVPAEGSQGLRVIFRTPRA